MREEITTELKKTKRNKRKKEIRTTEIKEIIREALTVLKIIKINVMK